MIDSHAGAATDQHELRIKVVTSRLVAVTQLKNTTAPKMAIITTTKLSSMMRNRRGSTKSARAPAGRVNRNIGRLLAASTIETARGSAFRFVISHAEAVSEIATPVSEQVVAAHITVNGRWEKAP